MPPPHSAVAGTLAEIGRDVKINRFKNPLGTPISSYSTTRPKTASTKQKKIMSQLISDKQWVQYERDGYLKLGQLLSEAELQAAQQRMDEIMLGKARLNYDRMLMQLDSDSGKYEDAGVQSKGFKGATLNYRKIQDLEFDSFFLAYMQRPVFREISRGSMERTRRQRPSAPCS